MVRFAWDRPSCRAALRMLALLAGSALLLLAGCTLRRTFDVQGRVVGFGDDGRTVIVEHEAVPNLMPAMTMSFKVRNADALAGFAQRDAIRFRLVLTRDSSWIDQLVALPDSAVAAYPAGQPDPAYPAPADPTILAEGDAIPPFTLIDQHGEAVQQADFEGRALLLTFIYTQCPIPEYCPRLSRHFHTLHPRLHERYGDRVRLLSISFDPENDTPETLRAYARRYTEDTARWTFATGTPDEIARLAQAFGVFYKPEGGQFDHNLATALIDPQGQVFRLWRGNTWQPDAVLQAVDAMLGL